MKFWKRKKRHWFQPERYMRLEVKADGFWKDVTVSLEGIPDVSLDVWDSSYPSDGLDRFVKDLTSSMRHAIWEHLHGTDYDDTIRDKILAQLAEDEAAA